MVCHDRYRCDRCDSISVHAKLPHDRPYQHRNFVCICAGIWRCACCCRDSTNSVKRGFKLPYINGRFIVPLLVAIFIYSFNERIKEDFQNMGKDNLQDILFLVFIVVAVVLAILSFIKKLSLIPIMGVLFCSYLLIEIPAKSWLWFFAWMAIGLTIYFLYGYRKSKLASEA